MAWSCSLAAAAEPVEWGDYQRKVTELVSFQLLEPSALDRMEALGADRAVVAALPKGWFISYNVDSGAEKKGRVF